ncbi:unnamed protein product [Phaedon cochleariae]|uniref:CUB domain-containing protein n=1 Tax=Phaedon cochleariae TaxID=80249 RepID=A0A9N9SKB5_PHACE|nr:unnamed protein product [Phaedon cochleariae]
MFVSHDGRHEKQGLLSHTAMALAGVLNFLMPASLTLNPNCDFRQDLILGQEYYIYNTQYPGQYPPSTSCTWYGRSEPGTRIVLACEDIALPSRVPNVHNEKTKPCSQLINKAIAHLLYSSGASYECLYSIFFILSSVCRMSIMENPNAVESKLNIPIMLCVSTIPQFPAMM